MKPKAKPAPKIESKPTVTNSNSVTGIHKVPEAKAEAICLAHSRGTPITRICKELSVSHHTVAAVIRNRPELLERAREFTRANWQTVAALGTAELIERIPGMKDQGLAILSAIATEKSELLAGNATQRVEHVAAPAADEWAAILAGMKKAQGNTKTAEIPAIEVEGYSVEADGIGVGIGKAAALPEPKQPANTPQIAPQTPAGGYQPSVSATADREQAVQVSRLVPSEAHNLTRPPAGTPGEEGMPSLCNLNDPYSNADQKFFAQNVSPQPDTKPPRGY